LRTSAWFSSFVAASATLGTTQASDAAVTIVRRFMLSPVVL
jgi:hypothetical protein